MNTWRSEIKLVGKKEKEKKKKKKRKKEKKKKKAGLRAHRGTHFSTSQHGTTWWSDLKLVRKGAGLRAQRGTLYSTGQHMVVRSKVSEERGGA